MPALADQRCLNHETREAVCRCPECKRFFCRECVSEHEFQMLCARCIGKAQRRVTADATEKSVWPGLVLAVVGILVAWLFFYVAGRSILQFRDSVPVAMLVKINA